MPGAPPLPLAGRAAEERIGEVGAAWEADLVLGVALHASTSGFSQPKPGAGGSALIPSGPAAMGPGPAANRNSAPVGVVRALSMTRCT